MVMVNDMVVVMVNVIVMVMVNDMVRMLSRPTSLSGNVKALDHDCFVRNDAIGLILSTGTVTQCSAMHCNAMQENLIKCNGPIK